jgi:hypothetical protein
MLLSFSTGCLDDGDEEGGSEVDPDDMIMEYYSSLDRGDYSTYFGFFLYNNGSFMNDRQIRENIDSYNVFFGREGQLIEIEILDLNMTGKEEVNTSIGRLTRYWYHINIDQEMSGIGEDSWEGDLLLIHIEESDRWGVVISGEVEDHMYNYTSMLRTYLLEDENGAYLKIENKGYSDYYWNEIQVLMDDVPIDVRDLNTGSMIWSDGYPMIEVFRDELETLLISYLLDEDGDVLELEDGSSHKITFKRKVDNFIFWESNIVV